MMESMVKSANPESSQRLAPRANEDPKGSPDREEETVLLVHLGMMGLRALMGSLVTSAIKVRPETRESVVLWDLLVSLVQKDH